MFGINAQRHKSRKEEAEKPFWISFSDLMTALMVLFLVAMAVALLAVTGPIAKLEAKGKAREGEIDSCMAEMKKLANSEEFNRDVVIRGYSIEFGKVVEFRNNEHTLNSDQERKIRAFVRKVLKAARNTSCNNWLKRVVVEGFASQVGSYLYNLNLSFLRSQRILCVVLDSQARDALSLEDRKQIRTLFLAGGSSFNSVSKSADEMRRVELKLEFLGLDENNVRREIPWDDDTKCPNDSR
jgi:hypothetical protein